jgi:hypothetical protein
MCPKTEIEAMVAGQGYGVCPLSEVEEMAKGESC